MLTTTPRPEWYRRSGVTECQECDGHGMIARRPYLHPNDPDNWNEDCDDCDGEGNSACETCGFDQLIVGYDCVVCETVYALTEAERAALDVGKLAEAFTRCLNAAQAEHRVEVEKARAAVQLRRAATAKAAADHRAAAKKAARDYAAQVREARA